MKKIVLVSAALISLVAAFFIFNTEKIPTKKNRKGLEAFE